MVLTNEEMDEVIQKGGWEAVASAMYLAIEMGDGIEAMGWYKRALVKPPLPHREFMAMLNKIANIDDSAPIAEVEE